AGRVAISERLQNHRIHDGEDGRTRPDPEGKRQNRHHGESGALPQGSQSIADVLNEDAPSSPAPHLTYLLLRHSQVAEGAAGGVARLFGSEAIFALLFGFQFQVRAQFALQILLARFSAPPPHLSSPRRAT